jgi:hypothetical protein
MLMMAKGKFHPWVTLALAIVAGAVLFALAVRWLGRSAPPAVARADVRRLPPPAPVATSVVPSAAPEDDALTPPELEHFRRNMRSAFLRVAFDDRSMSAAARALYIEGQLRAGLEANDSELATRASKGDRDAAAALLRLRSNCRNPAWLGSLPLAADRSPESVPQAGPRMPPRTRALVLAAIDLTAREVAAATAYCQTTGAADSSALEARVRSAAADGHAPSLLAIAMQAADDPTRERHLLSAAILGDARAELELARLYAQRAGDDPGSPDRAKIRFWLEQANNRLPAATFELGRCLAAGCDGRPPDAVRARALVETAAAQGYADAIETLAGVDAAFAGDMAEPAGPAERYAWLGFRARLARLGCYTDFAELALDSERSGMDLSQSLPAVLARQARAQADQLFRRYGAEAQATLACN